MALQIFQLNNTGTQGSGDNAYNSMAHQLEIAEDNIVSFYNLLKQYAEGVYFDTVSLVRRDYVYGCVESGSSSFITIERINELASSDDYKTSAQGTYVVQCKNNDKLVLEFEYRFLYNSTTSSFNYVETKSTMVGIMYTNYHHNGLLQTLHLGGNGGSMGTFFKYKQKINKVAITSNGILISFGDVDYKSDGTVSSSAISRFDLIIGKTEKGATVIITPVGDVNNSSSLSNNGDDALMVTSYDTASTSQYTNIKYNSEVSHTKTIMSNIPVTRENIDDDIIKNIMYMPFTQWKFNDRSSYSMLRINNIEYFYTGWLIVKV